LAILAVALPSVTHGQRADVTPRCAFPAVGNAINPVVIGPDSVTNRLQIVQPLDAPVRILRADFTGTTLWTDGTLGAVGFFRFRHHYSLEVINVTDQIVTAISPHLYASSRGDLDGEHAGGGGGPVDRIPLGPGQRREIRGSGTIEGNLQLNDDVRLRLGIYRATLETCDWNNFRQLFPFGAGKSTQSDTPDGSPKIPR
jgi:hypothetical protein